MNVKFNIPLLCFFYVTNSTYSTHKLLIYLYIYIYKSTTRFIVTIKYYLKNNNKNTFIDLCTIHKNSFMANMKKLFLYLVLGLSVLSCKKAIDNEIGQLTSKNSKKRYFFQL